MAEITVSGNPDHRTLAQLERCATEAHAGSIRIRHTLQPLGVAMASDDILDPYRD